MTAGRGFSARSREPARIGANFPLRRRPFIRSWPMGRLWLHRYVCFVAVAAALLITAGGLVTSTGSGLSVPDWPNTYGYSMITFPPSMMVGGIFYEHGHRLIATTVGLLTIGLAVWFWRAEPRAWVRRLGWIALGAVVFQGLLGGITVLYFLPAPVSIGHAGLAHLFFTLIVSLGVLTSPGWLAAYRRPEPLRDRTLLRLALLAPAAVYAQVLLGAVMRHTGAGLAIPDFPLAFGHLVPPSWSAAIGIHYAHRVGAAVVTVIVFAAASRVLAHHWARTELTRPAMLLVGLLLVQIGLGAWTVLSGKHVAVNTAHVTAGSLVLATAAVLALRVHRSRGTDAPERLGATAAWEALP